MKSDQIIWSPRYRLVCAFALFDESCCRHAHRDFARRLWIGMLLLLWWFMPWWFMLLDIKSIFYQLIYPKTCAFSSSIWMVYNGNRARFTLRPLIQSGWKYCWWLKYHVWSFRSMRYLKIVCRGFVPFSKFAAFPELQNFDETYFLTIFVAFFWHLWNFEF